MRSELTSSLPTLPRGSVYAEGVAIDINIAAQAAEWLTLLMSDDVSGEEKSAWETWRKAHPDHERAWQHIQKVSQGFYGLNGSASREALATRPIARRKGLKIFLWLSGIGITTGMGWRSQTGQIWLADLSTRVGERRAFTLADGSHLQLNSQSAVNIRYTNTQRVLQLVKGEAFVTTARETQSTYRPFLIETRHGQTLALGTRYAVRHEDDWTHITVEEGRVRVAPHSTTDSVIVAAGQTASMSSDRVTSPQAAGSNAWGWLNGQILADGMPLREFVHELSRYHSGLLSCDERVADLRISGVFPIDDTDTVLHSLMQSLPVQLRYRTRYWVQVEPRQPG
ncbi:FecR domain-containing protein [uncultured Oxalicibacterium sp.]|uniref:FecR domain-containing protein n=1 Tax=uncultured Oxalicibacterium sp. TaxID=1168540 RepID=UPI0025F4A3F2|nr:FecR domain-containing protein [uncultured Oxalicibacterium sp.]